LDYDKSRARFANMSLGEKEKNSLKNSSCKFGFYDMNMGSTYSSSFKPLENFRKILNYDKNNRKTNFELSSNKETENKTIYKTDFINRDME